MADKEAIERKRREERERRERRAKESKLRNEEKGLFVGLLPTAGPSAAAASSSSSRPRSSSSSSARASSARSSSRDGSRATPKLPRNAKVVDPASQKLLVNMKYSNEMPYPGGERKLMRVPLSLSRFVQYKPSSLEQAIQMRVIADAREAVPIDVVDPRAYQKGAANVGLDDVDRELLKGSAKPGSALRKHSRPTVSWMRRTEYISGDVGDTTLYTRRPESKRERRSRPDLDMPIQEQLDVIERTFEEANTPLEELSHPSKPNVTAVKQWHVFPDFELWENEYCQVSFADDPAPPPLEGESYEDPEQAQELCKGGLVHALRSTSMEDYIVFAVPRLNRELFEDLEAFEEKEVDEKEYRLVREYNMNFTQSAYDPRELVLVLDDEKGMAVYNPVMKKVELRKRQRDEDSFLMQQANDRVALELIDRTEADLDALEERRKNFEEEDLSALME